MEQRMRNACHSERREESRMPFELVRRSQRRTDHFRIEVEVIRKGFSQSGDGSFLKLNHEIEVVSGPGDPPVVAGHRTGQHVGATGPIQPAKTIGKQFLFRHGAARASFRRLWSCSSTAASLAPGARRRMPARAMSHAISCNSRAMASRCTPDISRYRAIWTAMAVSGFTGDSLAPTGLGATKKERRAAVPAALPLRVTKGR